MQEREGAKGLVSEERKGYKTPPPELRFLNKPLLSPISEYTHTPHKILSSTSYSLLPLPPPMMLICVPSQSKTVSSEGSRSERSSSNSTEYTSPSPSPSSIASSKEQTRHYRGMTFDDILPSHMITSAPPPDVDQKEQKRGHSKTASAVERRTSRHSAAPAPSPTTTEQPQPRSPTKRSYPSGKKASGGGVGGGKSRMRATARALVRGLSVVRQDSRKGGGYEAV
jgi:hypothetical protein